MSGTLSSHRFDKISPNSNQRFISIISFPKRPLREGQRDEET